MILWLQIALISVSAAFLSLTLLIIIRWARAKRSNDIVSESGQNLPNGVFRLHQVSPNHPHLDRDVSKKANDHLFRRGGGVSTKPTFSWSDHPNLVNDAVENGWSRFAFAAFTSSPSVKSLRLLGSYVAGDRENGVEIGWEVREGSADFMQRIRLSPNSSMAAAIRTALPLPGPNLGNSSFPQEAYFEITLLSCGEKARDRNREKKGGSEGDRIKLIGEDFKASSHSQRRSKMEEMKMGKEEGRIGNEGVFVCVGLSGGKPLPLRMPGSFQGSIGFNSNGSIYLDGTKLASESEDWGLADKVIGCGYTPSQKKVFFTVDSQIVQEIHCQTEDFSSPLYPTLAANADVVVLVNLGQSPFRFAAANLQRTPNPCFVGLMANSPSLGDEDSRELFSMGRIDSHWMQRSATRSNKNTVNSIKAMEYDQESEGDLFEIVLDSSSSTGRSPYITLNNYS